MITTGVDLHQLYSYVETAAILGIGESTLKKLPREQQPATVRIGGRVLFRGADIVAFMNRLCRRGVPDGYVSITEIEYLLETRGIDHVVLAGIPMVSLDGLRSYAERHAQELEGVA